MSLSDNLELWLPPSLTYVSADADCLVDQSSNGRDGVYNSSMGTSADTDSGGTRAFDCNSAGHHVSITAAGLNLTGEMTASVWVKPSSVTSVSQILCRYQSGTNYPYLCEVGRTASKVSSTWGGTVVVTSSVTISAGVWTHLLWVRTGSSGNWSADLYIDGVARGSATTSTNPQSASSSKTRVGNLNGSAHQYSGLIDAVAIWSSDQSAHVTDLASSRSYDWRSGSTPTYQQQHSQQRIIQGAI